MMFNGLALTLCLTLLFVTKAGLIFAIKKGDQRQARVLHLLRLGLSLSACADLLRLLTPATELARFGSFVCTFAGSLLIWIGWMEQGSLYRERSARLSAESEGGGAPEAAIPDGTGLPLLNAQVQQVMRHAQDEARLRRQGNVDTDHLLLGLLLESRSAGMDILDRLSVKPENIHLALGPPDVPDRCSPRPPLVTNAGAAEPLPLTGRAREALSLAAQEAHRFDRTSIGTDHLLLGLVLMGTGAAAVALFQEGVTVDGVRREVLKSRARG